MPQAKQFRLAEIADLLGAKLEGDGDIIISGLSPLSSAGEGQLSFLSNPTYTSQLAAKLARLFLPKNPPIRFRVIDLSHKTPT